MRRCSIARVTCRPTCGSCGWRTSELWLDLEPGPGREPFCKHLRTYSIGRDVEVEDATDRWAILSLIGPRSGEVSGFEGLAPSSRSVTGTGTESRCSPSPLTSVST